MRLLSISFLLGILCIQQFPSLPVLNWHTELLSEFNVLSPYFVAFAAVLLVPALVLTINHLWKYRLLTGFVCGLFYAFWASTSLLNTRLAPALEGESLIVSGTISSIPEQRKNGWSFRLNIEKASRLVDPDKQLPVNGTLRLGWYRTQQVIHAGETWKMVVRLKRPAGFMNSGGFDYEKWLFQERIIATGYVRKSTDNNMRISEAPVYSVNAIRERILRTINQRIENPQLAAIVSALAVADRAAITDQQWEVLRQTGTNHLIAISGLHIGMVAGFGFFPVMLIWWLLPSLYLKMPVRIAGGIAGAGLAIIYALLAGFTLPTQRALIMVLVVLFGLLARKQYSSSSILATALIAVLLYDPLAVLSQGFWLSFVAVGVIMFTVARRISRPRLVVDLITIQFALSLGMLPLTLALFGMGSLTAPLANLIAIPWVTLVVVPLTLLGVLLIPFVAVSKLLLNLAALSVDNMMQVLSLLSSPQAMISIPDIPAYLLIISFIGFIWLWLPSKFPGRWLGLLLLLPLVTSKSAPIQQGSFTFDLLDVGQGLASVVQTANHVLVYDTGPRASASFDTGKLVVLPFLRSQNIKHIDTMMVSHEDLDHRGGAGIILKTLPVDRLLSSDTRIFPNAEHCDKGMKWNWDGVSFEILHPEQNWSVEKNSDNNRSCVLRISNNNHSLLLTGDIQKIAERHILETDPTLKSEVIVIPHHGSKTSSTAHFINAVQPELALAAVGYRNRFHFPNKDVVKRYEKRGVSILTTVESGAIRIDFPANDEAFQVESYRKSHQYYWNK
ncbi:MAG: DNA internalization-related competence protein ComEC/Rec2 [Thiotrichaceae bacterium]